MAVGGRFAAGLDDVLRRREIRLADPEIDDRATLCRERVGARQHLECGLGPERAHARGHLQHSTLPDGRPSLTIRSRNPRRKTTKIAIHPAEAPGSAPKINGYFK